MNEYIEGLIDGFVAGLISAAAVEMCIIFFKVYFNKNKAASVKRAAFLFGNLTLKTVFEA